MIASQKEDFRRLLKFHSKCQSVTEENSTIYQVSKIYLSRGIRSSVFVVQ